MGKWNVIILAMAVLAISSTASAATYYVDNQRGTDHATGLAPDLGAQDGPVRTLAAAFARASVADRIELAATGVPYRESISLSLPRHHGFAGKPFTINGNGAVLDGTVVAAPGAWRHIEGNVFAMRPRRLAYQQLFSTGKPLAQVSLASPRAASGLQPSEWSLVDDRLYFATEGNQIPKNYDLRHAGLQTGVTLYAVRYVRIENLVLQGFQQDGINAHELVRDCELVDVECRANGRAGLSVGGVSRVSVVRGNFYDNGRVQVRTEGMAELDLVDCDVDDTGTPAYKAKGRSLRLNGEPIQAP